MMAQIKVNSEVVNTDTAIHIEQLTCEIKHTKKMAYLSLGSPLTAARCKPKGTLRQDFYQCWGVTFRMSSVKSFTTPIRLQA